MSPQAVILYLNDLYNVFVAWEPYSFILIVESRPAKLEMDNALDTKPCDMAL